jgi:hypothetical protein
MSIVVLVLAQSHEEFGPHFQQKPFFRCVFPACRTQSRVQPGCSFFSSMLCNLHAIESYIGASCYTSILSTLSCAATLDSATSLLNPGHRNQIQTLQPVYFPGFAFSWLSLISHRLYMPRLLDSKWPEGNALFHKHLLSMLRFLSPFLRSGELRETIKALYFGLLKVLLMLLHECVPCARSRSRSSSNRSFPDFLAAYAPSLVGATPVACTQLINVFVSAFPSHIKLPDPFGDQVDSLPEMSKLPPVVPAGTSIVSMPAELQAALDKVISGEAPVTQLAGLANRFLLPESMVTDLRYNFPLLDLVVHHLCTAAVGSGKTTFSATSPSVVLFERLLADLDVEGRYLLASAAANLLRWPSAHTRWARHLLLHVFTSAELGTQEVVTRVLLERCVRSSSTRIPRADLTLSLLVARPHPWGIVWAMSGLIRRDLVSQDFVTKVRRGALYTRPARPEAALSTRTLLPSSPRSKPRSAEHPATGSTLVFAHSPLPPHLSLCALYVVHAIPLSYSCGSWLCNDSSVHGLCAPGEDPARKHLNIEPNLATCRSATVVPARLVNVGFVSPTSTSDALPPAAAPASTRLGSQPPKPSFASESIEGATSLAWALDRAHGRPPSLPPPPSASTRTHRKICCPLHLGATASRPSAAIQ